MSESTKRFFSGLIYTTLLVGAVFLSKNLFVILITILGILCLIEFAKLRYFKNLVIYPVLILAVYYFNYHISDPLLVFLLLGINIVVSSVLIVKLLTGKENKITLLSNYIFSFFYISSGILFITLLPSINTTFDYQLILSVFIIMWTNDTFAYLVGKKFGKRKLYEKVSPKKTIEGFLGGFIFSLLVGILLYFMTTHNLTILQWITLASIIVVFGTLGDLVQSQFKRFVNIKDSGNILPGHGGIYDRLDSIIFVAPFVYTFLYLITHVS